MKLYSILIFLLLASFSNAQQIWNLIDEGDIKAKDLKEREIVPEAYRAFDLDFDRMVKQLRKSPLEKDIDRLDNAVMLELPTPEGRLEVFKFYESPCFSPVLSTKFPQIKSYRGISTENNQHQARIDYGTQGFHGVIKSNKGTIYIDPYFTKADGNYISYYIKDHMAEEEDYMKTCGFDAYKDIIEESNNPTFTGKSAAVPVIKTTYRTAIACTAAWGQIFVTVENILSRMNTAVNRLNMIFENEIAVKFELVDDNEKLIFLDSDNEPYSQPNMGRVCLGENTDILNGLIGSDAYDIGHVFTVRCLDGIAGVAQLASLCQNNKGAGVSCVGTSNISAFMVNTTAHELGHQFSGGHSWNNCPGNEGQFSPGTGWEPGSGSTILSYAGACGIDNIAGTNDDYFHVGSLEQFINLVDGVNCGLKEDSGNHTPDISIPYKNGFYIPISTPFELEGEASDIDGDVMTFNWEQMNVGPSSPLGSPLGNAPSFRSLKPGPNKLRSFPRLNAILTGTDLDTEVLPTYSRDFNFRFVAKDNHPGAGYTVWEEVAFKATSSAGPFKINYPDQVLFKEVGDTLTIGWDVANTDNGLVNCHFVDLYLSVDNGQNFDLLLKSKTPNDGSETIIIPNRITNNAKIKIKANNNIFFNIGRPDLIIKEPETPGFFIDVSNNNFDFCLPDQVEIDVTGTAFQDFINPVTLEIVSGLPAEANYSFSENPIAPDGISVLNIDMSDVLLTGVYDVLIQATSEDSDTVNQIVTLNVTGSNFDEFATIAPASGSVGLGGTPEFSWVEVANATEYTLEVSTSPAFGTTNVIFEEGITSSSIIPQIALNNSTLYYWRVSASNDCVSKKYLPIQTFGTVALSCRNFSAEDLPRNISASGRPSISSIIEVFDQGTVTDVNISNIKGVHQRIGDLKATLVSPTNQEVILFENRCFSSNFNVGFDADSPVNFTCSLNSGITMKPEKGSLPSLFGEEMRGEWTLRIDDTVPGEGGQFQGFDLELCSNSSLDNPFIVNNNVLEVPTGLSARIFNNDLLSEDPNNTADDLIYTLVEAPENGTLFFEGEALIPGSQFTQSDLNDKKIKYTHEGTEDETDSFVFTVIDGEGGWIDLTRFDIITDADFVSSSDELLEENHQFELYPNPVNNVLHIHNMTGNYAPWEIRVFSLSGQLVLENQMTNRTSLDISNINAGVYVLRISNEKGSLIYKVSVVK